jgi:tRNA 2-thiouridine synthesizing protein A
VIRVQDLVSRLAPGDEVTAACTDPGVLNDIPAWCRINGHEILDIRASETECFVVLRVGCRT